MINWVEAGKQQLGKNSQLTLEERSLWEAHLAAAEQSALVLAKANDSQAPEVFVRKVEPRDILVEAVKRWKTQPHSPQLLRETWQMRYEAWEQQAGLDFKIEVPEFPTTKILVKVDRQESRPGFVAEPLASQESRYLLARIWPELGSYSVKEENTVVNKTNPAGWKYFMSSLKAPFLGTNQEQLEQALAKDKWEGMNVNEYILASEDSKLLTNHHLDEETWSRLLGSLYGGEGVFGARFNPVGLRVYWALGPLVQDPRLGGRGSQGV